MDDVTGVSCIVETTKTTAAIATITIAPNIGAHKVTANANCLTDAAIATISLEAGTVQAASTGSAVRATSAVRVRQIRRGCKAMTVVVTRRVAARNASGKRDTMLITSTLATQVMARVLMVKITPS